MFNDQPRMDRIQVEIPYHPGIQHPALLAVLRDAITLLEKSVAAALGPKETLDDKKLEAPRRLTLGFCLLAMSEGRAALVLLSLGLERSARVHLRSLFEYNFRASLVQSPEKARMFQLAAMAEAKLFIERTGGGPEELAKAEAQFLFDRDEDEAVVREKAALGDMLSQLRERYGSDSEYATRFAWPSLFSHGSILALYEVSHAIAGKGKAFAEHVFMDLRGPFGLLEGARQVAELALLLVKVFGVETLDEWDALFGRLDELTAGLPDIATVGSAVPYRT
jgi:hypothetical protein